MPLSLEEAYEAWQRARRRKKPSASRWRFERRWLDSLADLAEVFRAGTWQPRHTYCFVVRRPKTRQVHAPDFIDRVVHHWLVPKLEAVWEPRFIHDSFGNRREKGTHAAVRRLQDFMRQRKDGHGGGWSLQLDVHNCFNSIHRPTLYRMLVRGLEQATRQGRLDSESCLSLRSICHRALTGRARIHLVDRARHDRLPPHKRLDKAAPGRGIPVGNLSSQFFVNVYLDALDQFVKHELKVRYYIRFVDDMVLLGDSPAQLQDWQSRMAAFLEARLGLRLRSHAPLRPIGEAIPFLGYQVRASHLLPGTRVLSHAAQMLRSFERRHIRQYRDEDGRPIWLHWRADAIALQELQNRLNSYWAHLAHASAVRSRLRLWQRFSWLAALFDSDEAAAGRLVPRWRPHAERLSAQTSAAQRHWPMDHGVPVVVWAQVGPAWLQLSQPGRQRLSSLRQWVHRATERREPFAVLGERGWLRHGGRCRVLMEAAGPWSASQNLQSPISMNFSING